MRRWISLCLLVLLLAACAPVEQNPPVDGESIPPVTTEPVTDAPITEETSPMTTTDSLTITPVTTAAPETTTPINWDKTLEKFFAEQFGEDKAEPKAVEIPRDVLWDGSFYTPGNCTGFTVEEGNTAYCAVDGVLYSADMTRLVAYPVASDATSFTVPDSVKNISQGAFAGSRNLTRVELPDGLEIIGTFAFGYCQALTEIRLPNSLTEIWSMAFKDCDALTMVAIPGSVTYLGAAAFYCCDSLTTAIIGEGVTTIEHNAFADCPSLTMLMIPGTVERIHGYYYGHEPFKDSPWFASQTDEFVIVGDGVLIAYNGTATDVVLPAEVKSIAGGIVWPDTVKFITMPKAMYDQLYTMPHCLNTAEITIIPVE
ncbi:MAG: leucine-rich repeat domain-containing protein [Clostridia bacterium]|nr:leucine-rich repeat domain-containing protein [Clostridia bacterium]